MSVRKRVSMGGKCSSLKNFCRSCGIFMYDKTDGTFCRKSCSSWSNVFSIYLTYVVIVVIVFGAALYGLHVNLKAQSLDSQIDKSSLVLDNFPKLVIYPRLPKASLIWYKINGTAKDVGPKYYIDYLDKFFAKYENLDRSKYVDCNVTEPTNGRHCLFTKKMLGPCGVKGYGYLENKPCIFLKLNKMRYWVPWSSRFQSNPPTSTDEYEEIDARVKPMSGNPYQVYKNTALLARCTGATSFSCDHLGRIKIRPNGIYYYFFPYNGSEHYLSPIIGVKFMDLLKGIVIAVNCSVFGTSITHEYQYAMLSDVIHFYVED